MKSRSCLAFLASFLFAVTVQAAEPKVGDVAPPISASLWLQGSEVKGFQKGTVYVLEFWATWCGSCHASQPHLNALAKKLSGKPVVFVNITSEEKGVVSSFLAKRPMNTRVALDKKHATFDAYGVQVLPHTVIVGRDGKIAAITRPEDVTESALDSVMGGKRIDLPIKTNKAADLQWDAELAGIKKGSLQDMGHAILQRSDAISGASHFAPNSGQITGDGLVLQNLIQIAYGSEYLNTKVNITDPDISPLRVSVKAPDGKNETARAMLKELIHRSFAFKAEWREIEKDMYVLRFDASKANGKFKKSNANKLDGMARHGSINVVKVNSKQLMDYFSSYGFGEMVVDETGLTGEYDLELKWNVAEKGAFTKALQEAGFSYTREKRKTKMLVVDPA